MNRFFITTPIYYVNDVPHIGHAYTTVAADVLARYWRGKLGKKNVFFLTGTDEHGQKVAQAAKEAGVSPKEYADSVAPRFIESWKQLNITYDNFIRTTDPKHEKVVTELLQKIYDNGYIYKGTYEGLYCVGCEKFLTETELINGRCPLHPNKEPIHQKEENYFLKLGELSKKVFAAINNGDYEIIPGQRKNEVIGRLKAKVEDISISRAGVSWGIPVPWDKTQTIYVWVDALINYYSATKIYPEKESFWPADLHLVGKDILWFHTVIWQALLLAAGIALPKAVFAHGFFTIDGAKMSKSLGNVISPKELVERYGVDAARYLLISAYPFGDDGDISISRFDAKYNSDLADGLGNLVSRVAKLSEKLGLSLSKPELTKRYQEKLEGYGLYVTLENIQAQIVSANRYIDENAPWKITDKKKLKEVLTHLGNTILSLALELKPFMPVTSEKIEKQFTKGKIVLGAPLFPRIK